MANWRHTVKINHLLTKESDHESVQKSMNEIANIIVADPYLKFFSTTKFRKIPRGDDFFSPADYANKLLANMYDYADSNLIWIE
jgi:3-oxoacyl-[acyl-carrier-protein] synthase III